MTEPTPPAETADDTKRDAMHRAVRTFLQGLLTDLLIAAVVFLYPVITSAESVATIQWGAVGLSLAKTALVTFLSYLMRVLKISPQTT